MKIRHNTNLATIAVVLLLLGGCVTKPPQTVYIPPPPVDIVEPPAPVANDEFRRARLLADILYDARLAYEDNRLMTPSGSSAWDLYRNVLNLDPGNAVALAGIQEIVLRYIQLADAAVGQGLYDNAASLLDRGASLNPDRPELAAARQRLAEARKNRLERFDLDPAGISGQGIDMLNQLADIAQYIQQQEATFQIFARTDDEGRWIYKVMREAVGGYRLRGNIGIGAPAILINQPPG